MNQKLICTRENRAPRGEPWTVGCMHSKNWNRAWDHPDATDEVINEEHDDIKVSCPHCGQAYVSEGIDS